jgi:hypothetical protein
VLLTDGRFELLWRLNLLLNNSQEELELVFTGVLKERVERSGSLRFIQDLEPCEMR